MTVHSFLVQELCMFISFLFSLWNMLLYGETTIGLHILLLMDMGSFQFRPVTNEVTEVLTFLLFMSLEVKLLLHMEFSLLGDNAILFPVVVESI